MPRSSRRKKIHERLSIRQVKCLFNPPGAPHLGGAWESLVKSAKRALVRILAKQVVTDGILVMTLAIVENILNGRPLRYLTNDATEPEVLTPNHLLLGGANPNIPFDLFNTSIPAHSNSLSGEYCPCGPPFITFFLLLLFWGGWVYIKRSPTS